MKKNKWITIKGTDLPSASNDVSIEGDYDTDFEVKVVDENDNTINKYKDVKGNERKLKVVIIMKFHWKTDNFNGTDDSNITYYLKNSDNWEIVNEKQTITVKLDKGGEFQKTLKEAHKKLLKKKFSNKFGEPKKDIEETEDLQYIIGDNTEGENINVIISGKNTPPPNDSHFNWDKVEIKAQFGLTKQVNFDDVISINYQEKKTESKLTPGWITFFVIFLTIVVLIVVFWKKIWNWIKGEREQEKKVKEQLDIF